MYLWLLLSAAAALDDCQAGVSFLQTGLERHSKASQTACPDPEAMRNPFAMQLSGGSQSKLRSVETCGMLSQCVDTTSSAAQDAWAKVKAIDTGQLFSFGLLKLRMEGR